MNDTEYMRRAIGLARPGKTFPNPAVGCVIVKEGRIIAEGATGDGGRPHAEEVALSIAGEAANGATAYVTLEPCGARSNGGLSCSERLVAAKVARVVYASHDPSDFANHLGPQRLKDAQITVEAGLLAAEAEFLIAPSRHFLATGLAMISLSDDGVGCDAPLLVADEDDLLLAVQTMTANGFRHLWVSPEAPSVEKLKALRLLSES